MQGRLLRSAVGVFVSGFLVFGSLAATQVSAAPVGDPSPDPNTTLPGNPGAGATASSTYAVPAGVCRARLSATGGNGNSTAGDQGRGGNGANVTATYAVIPGQTIGVRRHAGGAEGPPVTPSSTRSTASSM